MVGECGVFEPSCFRVQSVPQIPKKGYVKQRENLEYHDQRDVDGKEDVSVIWRVAIDARVVAQKPRAIVELNAIKSFELQTCARGKEQVYGHEENCHVLSGPATL